MAAEAVELQARMFLTGETHPPVTVLREDSSDPAILLDEVGVLDNFSPAPPISEQPQIVNGNSLLSQPKDTLERIKSDYFRQLANKGWADPEYRQNREHLLADPEYRQRMSDQKAKLWATQEYHQRVSDKLKQLRANADYRQAMTDQATQLWADPEYRQKTCEGIRQVWEKKGNHVRKVVEPLALRGFEAKDIMNIAKESIEREHLTKRQVSNATDRIRRKAGILRGTPERVSQEVNEQIPQTGQSDSEDDKKKNLAFMKAIYTAGLLPEELSYRKAVLELFENHRIVHNPGVVTRLEVLLAALDRNQAGDPELLDTYRQIGEEVDAKWFRGSLIDETKFLIGAVTSTSGTESQETVYSESTRQEGYRIEGDNSKEIIEPLDVRVVEKLLRLLTEEEKTFIILLNEGLNYGQISEIMGSSLSRLSDLETRIVIKLPNSEFGSWVKEACERSHEGISVDGAGEDSAPSYLSSGFYTEEVPHAEEEMNEQGESLVLLPVHEIEEIQEEITLNARERRRQRLQRDGGMSSEVINGESTERFTFNGFVPVEERADDHNLSPLSDGNGGQVPWEEFFQKYKSFMTGVLWNIGIRDSRDREELLQEATYKIIKKMEASFKAGSMDAWVGKTTASVGVDRQRWTGRRKETFVSEIENEYGETLKEAAIYVSRNSDRESSPEDIILGTETVEEVIALLQRLPEGRRDVVALRLFGELSYSEIAESTDLALGTVKSNLNRGITELRRLLAEQNKAA